VYRDGSIYSYSYRDRSGAGQTDKIYAPADDEQYEDDEFDPEPNAGDAPQRTSADYETSSLDPEDDEFDSSDLDEVGVVDADYRVIIPPAQPHSPAPQPKPSLTDDQDDNTPSS
jgi:hypothetical protein